MSEPTAGKEEGERGGEDGEVGGKRVLGEGRQRRREGKRTIIPINRERRDGNEEE